MSQTSSGFDPRPERTIGLKYRRLLGIGFSFLSCIVTGTVIWAATQFTRYYSEQQAKVTLESKTYPGAIALTSLATCYPQAAPSLGLSELRHGRLYVPVNSALVGGGGFPSKLQPLDQVAWDRLTAFRYLEHLSISGCSCDTGLVADFSGFKRLKHLAITDTQFSPRAIATLVDLPQLIEAMFESQIGFDRWLPSIGRLRHLRTLRIAGDVSDAGLTVLVRRELELWGLSVSEM